MSVSIAVTRCANVYCQYSISTCARAAPGHESASASNATSPKLILTIFVVMLSPGPWFLGAPTCSPRLDRPMVADIAGLPRGRVRVGEDQRPVRRLRSARGPRHPIIRVGDASGATAMNETLPSVYLARHGETAWSLSGRHTGLTDLPLTERGEANARELGERLRSLAFGLVLTSPLQRAKRTCQLAGFGSAAVEDRDLVEWNYGSYEGRARPKFCRSVPGWQLFRDGCPGGESPADTGSRADRVIARIRARPAMCWCSRAATSCASSGRVGSVCLPAEDDISCSVPRA
jgi:hypothetical protein